MAMAPLATAVNPMTGRAGGSKFVDYRLEVAMVPVSNVDKTKHFARGSGGDSTPISTSATASAWCN